MNLSMFQAASGMDASARWQEVTAENLAAGQVPGFKRQEVAFEPFIVGMMPGASGSTLRQIQPQATVKTDFSPSGLRSTGVETDVALDGQGFFAVQLPSGAVAYTRDGEFHRTPAGDLVTKSGYKVLGETGPIQLDPDIAEMAISPSGEISQKSGVVGNLRIVGFSDPNKLTPIGGGLFVSNAPGLKPVAVPDPSVRQGFLELSNSNPVAEMTRLVSSLRMFEMNQRVIQSQDERLGRTISELAPQG